MFKTPGFITSSPETPKDETEKNLRRLGELSGFTAFDVSEFVEEDSLLHYGIKGMKWGVIRDRVKNSAVGKAYSPSDDAVKAQQYMVRAKLGGVKNLNNREMQAVIRRMDLERQYKDLYGERQWHTAGKKWATKFATDVLKDVASSWLRNPFAKKNDNNDPVRVKAWTAGQSFAGSIESTRPKSIGR